MIAVFMWTGFWGFKLLFFAEKRTCCWEGVFQCLDGDLPSWCPTMVALIPDLAGCVVHFVLQLGFVKLNADKAAGSCCWGKWKAAIALFAVSEPASGDSCGCFWLPKPVSAGVHAKPPEVASEGSGMLQLLSLLCSAEFFKVISVLQCCMVLCSAVHAAFRLFEVSPLPVKAASVSVATTGFSWCRRGALKDWSISGVDRSPTLKQVSTQELHADAAVSLV
ncbi:hypothetical protein Nepgr_028952 [Nepenthes gracilis]|uniref:Uncharacterized protein n=1 Tax=Nepenthes gracilis TaxID=150966 RepID=A0AAD3TDV3_NEPGR|nr:hypothetical protein Nepgr_028952 [Nepenthes gracilis]